MPTAAQFRNAAERFRAAADDAAGLNDRIWNVGNNHGIVRGTLETVVDTAVVANALSADSLRSECESLADLCLERAVICDEYTAEYAAWEVSYGRWSERRLMYYRSLDDDLTDRCVAPPGPPPSAPGTPPSWVERG